MRINFILPFKRMSGGIRVVYIYANYLEEQGHSVCCYLPMVSYKGIGQSIPYRIRASISNTIKKENWFDCHFPIKVIPLIKDSFVRDADVVIATSWQTAYDVKKLCKSKGKKYYFVQGYEVFNGEVDLVENTYKLGMPIITISEALKQRLNKFSNNVSVIYNGIFKSEYIVGEKRSNRKFTIMFMYHESSHKGTKDALKVVQKVTDKYKDVKIIVFGKKLTEELPSSYKKLENPRREDLILAYQESDIYLFTSKIEAWGLPIVEAMANKCVVVGRSIGALAELYNEKNAVIADNVDDMFKAVTELYDNRVSLRKIQNEAYTVAKSLNWKCSCEKFEEFLMG